MLIKTRNGAPLYIGNAAFTIVKVPSGHAGLNFNFSAEHEVGTIIVDELFDVFIARLEK